MVREKDIFSKSGPVHLTTVDWDNRDHRRSVAACLVKGVYVLEFDREEERMGSAAEAPHWWNSFNFQVTRVLIDETGNNSIFGAIYELKSFISIQNAPRTIIAFRGTITKPPNVIRDFKHDMKVIRNTLDRSQRFRLAMQAIEETVNVVGAANVWLAGHSLGSAMALVGGKNMAKEGLHLKTYLFNQPYVSGPLGINKASKGIRIMRSLAITGLFTAKKRRNQNGGEDDLFSKLSDWTPIFFVNPHDLICRGYIGYFEHRKTMKDIGAWKIEKVATQNSVRGILSDSQPLHLVPSADVEINKTRLRDIRRAHGLQQWWNPDNNIKFVQYRF